MFVTITYTISMYAINVQDQGVWTCSAKNKHGIAQTKANIIAQGTGGFGAEGICTANYFG